ncbi:hypothetical protein RB8507 [Rhodopirellula baltica SH 1]|uniref:Uncharacterized protein n=1 Tax=Rhodopirellula baltica (strain DSM 10527 / NCIMB 13988 / SH1) TaxID=243090 RepID=Q7UFK6_RHOBA|nr:hypothetical protein RB8507 [Rhodopirellula baltica SH 1]
MPESDVRPSPKTRLPSESILHFAIVNFTFSIHHAPVVHSPPNPRFQTPWTELGRPEVSGSSRSRVWLPKTGWLVDRAAWSFECSSLSM